MPDDGQPPAPADDDERDIQAMVDGLREGLKDPATRRYLNRLAGAAMGDEAVDEPAAPTDPPQRR